MKRCIMTFAAVVSLSISALADVDTDQVRDIIHNQLPQIYELENPTITTTYIKPGKPMYIANFKKQHLTLCYDNDGLVISGKWPLSTEYDESFIWGLRPDIPRDKMVKFYRGIYLLKRDDGLLDNRVMVSIANGDNRVSGFSVMAKATDKPLPVVNLSPQDAYHIANDIAKNWVYDLNGTNYNWPCTYDDDALLRSAVVYGDINDNPYIAYPFNFYLSDKELGTIDSNMALPKVFVLVSATTGDIIVADILIPASNKMVYGIKTTNPTTKLPVICVTINTKQVTLGFPLVVVKNQAYIALTTVQNLAKGHALAAKANTKAFSLDGKQVALDAKALNRKGMLYLPWQALNSLPGVKAQFDAKQAKLDITTTATAEAATK